jgi:hypothetical protein
VKNGVFVALGRRLMFISYPMRLKLPLLLFYPMGLKLTLSSNEVSEPKPAASGFLGSIDPFLEG